MQIDFTTFDESDGDVDDYALWMRAFRSLIALLELHAMKTAFQTGLTLDQERQCLVESVGSVSMANCLTEQVHPDCGFARLDTGRGRPPVQSLPTELGRLRPSEK